MSQTRKIAKNSYQNSDTKAREKNNSKPGRDYISVGGGVLIINDNNETLLLKRSANSKNEVGYWNKPGGSVEFGETVWRAMERG